MYPKLEKLNISAWAEDDRPREKLLSKGRTALSDAELLAILIGSGNQEENAVDLCKRILVNYENNLAFLSKANLSELTQFKGIGEAKAITIMAAMEIGRRRTESELGETKQITSSRDAFILFNTVLLDLVHEEFWAIYLNRANKVLKKKRISTGGINGTIADVRVIFNEAIALQASGLIVGHNHPSGNLTPSRQDLDLTKKIREAGKILDVNLLDHLILAENKYFSFSDEGQL